MENRVYGYVRVSTKEQNITRQIQALLDYGIKERDIITDKVSGRDFNREGYVLLRDKILRSGDTLVIKELDRLGRNMSMIKEEWHQLQKNGVSIVIIDTPILNTQGKTDLEKTLISNIVFELLSYMSEKERIKIKQRQLEGIKELRKRNNGKGIGRPQIKYPENWSNQYNRWKNKNITAKEFMESLNLKRTTFYKLLNKYKKN